MFKTINHLQSKPFLKWAGGKTQLLSDIEKALPKDLQKTSRLTYIEPFVGSGAVMFWFLKRFRNVHKAIINDINPNLTNAYQVIKNQPYDLIAILSEYQNQYNDLKLEEDRRKLFIDKRLEFNGDNVDILRNTALLIFLNKTCFNGLYRVNSKNIFNVPFGKYEKPNICDAETILANSKILQNVTILNGDYAETLYHAEENTFFYLDPPYKPLTKTASFTSYSSDIFDDRQQERLANFCRLLNAKNYSWLLSNSDIKNVEIHNNYFDDLYSDFNIQRVQAKRSINSDATKRGLIYELLITNYQAIPQPLVLF